MEVFFSNQEKEIIDKLLIAKNNVKIAVAWIDFQKYKDIFNILLERGISLCIITNDDQKTTDMIIL